MPGFFIIPAVLINSSCSSIRGKLGLWWFSPLASPLPVLLPKLLESRWFSSGVAELQTRGCLAIMSWPISIFLTFAYRWINRYLKLTCKFVEFNKSPSSWSSFRSFAFSIQLFCFTTSIISSDITLDITLINPKRSHEKILLQTSENKSCLDIWP